MKAIETVYNGYRFRSRLEARWAVFFDAIGADWEYEPEGYELRDGTKYLPDFLIHGVQGRGAENIFVEIKGQLTHEDLHKIELFAFDENGFLSGYPIIIFGRIPEKIGTEDWDIDFSKDKDDHFYNLEYSEGDYYWTEPKAAKGGGLVLDYPDNPYDFVDDKKTVEAYAKASQARFEYGEKGGTGNA